MKGSFIEHVEDALWLNGLNPFLDKKSQVNGNPTFISIEDTLKATKIYIAIISKGYAKLKYCLYELVAIMRSGKLVILVFL